MNKLKGILFVLSFVFVGGLVGCMEIPPAPTDHCYYGWTFDEEDWEWECEKPEY